MRKLAVVTLFGLMCSGVVYADVRADEKSVVKFEGMLGRMVGLFGGRAARDGVTTTVIVKGDRKRTINDNNSQIVDLAEEKIYDIDTRDKSYKVTTFAQLRQQMEEARKKMAAEQQKQGAAPTTKPGTEVDIDFNLSETGQSRTVNGFAAREVLMTIAVREKGKTLEQSGGMVLTSNIWLAPSVAGMSEVADFDRRFAEKLASSLMLDAQQMAAAVALYPQMQQAMARMQAENVKMDGTPVMTVVKVETVASADQAAAAAAQQKKEEPAPRGLGGLGARLGARALGRGNNDNAAAATPGRATVMTTQHELLKVTPAASDADVAVPAGFKLKT